MTESDPQREQLAPVAPATPPVAAPPVAAPPPHPVAPPMPPPPTGYGPTPVAPNPAYQGYSVPPPGWAPIGAPASAPVPRGLSIASLITAMIGLLVSLPMAAVGLLFGVCGVVFGFVAKRKEPRATGLWLTGIIIGFVAITFALLAFTVVLVLGSIRGIGS